MKKNPFISPAFWGRRKELQKICNYLLSDPPQSCPIIGETFLGKTTLLRAFIDEDGPELVKELKMRDNFTFAYIDCISYLGSANLGEYTSAQFWWDLYNETRSVLKLSERVSIPRPQIGGKASPIDTAFDIKSEVVDILRGVKRPVVFLFDNFEGVAHLPPRNSEWLRSMSQYPCAYVVSSRNLLYLLYQYHPENMVSPSPLWNIFSEPVYLGLMAEDEEDEFLVEAKKVAEQAGSCWTQEDSVFIQKLVGRHPELLRIACVQLFEYRQQSDQFSTPDMYDYLDFSISRESEPICNYLWIRLEDPNLSGEQVTAGYLDEKERTGLSPYQKALIEIARGRPVSDKRKLFVLEERGLIERMDSKWRVFGEVMRQYVLKQEQLYWHNKQASKQEVMAGAMEVQTPGTAFESMQKKVIKGRMATIQESSRMEQKEIPALTHLEGEVYNYLKKYVGMVCSKEQIKSAVWDHHAPGNSALQKIIERIREKIEPDPDHPRYLIAVRGQGFMLREDIFGMGRE
jgi:DNA-binding winged helix-turn-helix (wHTH) protein